MIKTFKYKLKPNSTQKQTFDEWINTCRALYNLALEQKIYAYQSRNQNVSKYDSYNQLPELKKEFTFFKNVHSDVLQEVLDRLHKSYQSFYKGNGFPKFQKKGFYNSFTFKRNIKIENNYVKLPKIGKVKFFNSRPLKGKIKIATIIKENNSYYICIVCEFDKTPKTIDNNHAIGLDLGLSNFITTSDREFIDLPFDNFNLYSKIKRLQRKLSRQKKGSNSRNKTKRQISKTFRKIRNKRLDGLHKVSTYFIQNYSDIFVEDLNIKNMLESNNKKLNRSISESGLSMFLNLLEYKSEEYGVNFLKVNPAFTSQMCSECGHTSKENRKTQSGFKCVKCNFKEHADINAAKNILVSGRNHSTKVKPLG